MIKPIIISILYLLLLCANGALCAEPEIIYDSGMAMPVPDSALKKADKFRDQLFNRKTVRNSASKTVKARSTGVLDIRWPLHVDGISFARIKRYPVELPNLKAPICVIGSDDKSLSWLVTYREQLISLNARCLLVEAQSIEDMRRVVKYAKTIPVVPDLNGYSVGELGLAHYPVLVSSNWIEQ